MFVGGTNNGIETKQYSLGEEITRKLNIKTYFCIVIYIFHKRQIQIIEK